MAKLEPGLAGKLSKLIRMLGSDQQGEILSTVAAIKRTLGAGGADLHMLADRIMSSGGPTDNYD